MPDKITVSITSFEPLTVAFPDVAAYTSDIFLALPSVHVKLYDLSMGGIIPGGPHIGGDGQVFGLDFHLNGGSMTAGQLLEMIQKIKPDLIEMHRIVQEKLNEHGALL